MVECLMAKNFDTKAVRPAIKRHHFWLEPYLFLLPALLVFGMFLYYPFFRTIFLSMFLTNKTGHAKIFVAFTDKDNYLTLFQSNRSGPVWP